MKPDLETDVAIIGAGTAGLYALREVRRARRDFVLIDHGPLGTTCARVGCMPSKIALHAGGLWAARADMARMGVRGIDALTLDTAETWSTLRAQRDHFSGNAAGKARSAAGDRLIEGRARFIEPTVLQVDTADGLRTRPRRGDRHRHRLPAGDAEMARAGGLAYGQYRRSVRAADAATADRCARPRCHRSRNGAGAVAARHRGGGSRRGRTPSPVSPIRNWRLACDRPLRPRNDDVAGGSGQCRAGRRGRAAPRSGGRETKVDLLLAAMGRRANTDALGLAEAGFQLGAYGEPLFDAATMQIGAHPVFIAGDANALRPLMHEAADEGAIAGYNAARGIATRFRRRVSLGIAFSDPDVCAVGARFDELDPDAVLIGSATGEANGRSRILGGEASQLLRVCRPDGRASSGGGNDGDRRRTSGASAGVGDPAR
jgi:dihydrolipoamide dehydrogenase